MAYNSPTIPKAKNAKLCDIKTHLGRRCLDRLLDAGGSALDVIWAWGPSESELEG
jgi:hypothetical protein